MLKRFTLILLVLLSLSACKNVLNINLKQDQNDPNTEICYGDFLTNSPYAKGAGTLSDPYIICTADQFSEITNNLSHLNSVFSIKKNLDFSDVSFDGIGDSINPFTGKILGNNHILSNIAINKGSGDEVGLINSAKLAYISNLILKDITITATNSDNVGGLIGYCDSSVIKNVSILNSNISGNSFVGSLMGDTYGCNGRNIIVNGAVSAISSYAGGLSGYASSLRMTNIEIDIINNSPTAYGVGGLIGGDGCPDHIQNAHVRGIITGNDSIGGFEGDNSDGLLIYRSSFTGTLNGTTNIGGFTGSAYDSPLYYFSCSADVTINGESNLGGFVGYHGYRTRAYDSYVKGSINSSGATQNNVGGFWGFVQYYGDIYTSYSNMTITGSSSNVGGAVGNIDYWNASYGIDNSFVVNDVQGSSASNTVSLFTGVNTDIPLTGTNFYYWSGATCDNQAGGGCNSMDGTPHGTLSDFYAPGILPLFDFWNFDKIWQIVPDSYPILNLTQYSVPSVSHTCSNTGQVAVAYQCTPVITDDDINETRFIILEEDHSCGWLSYSLYSSTLIKLTGTPTADDIGTCLVSFIVTDGKYDSQVFSYTLNISP